MVLRAQGLGFRGSKEYVSGAFWGFRIFGATGIWSV